MSKYVVVTTKHRGVFFGLVESTETAPASIDLKEAQMCIYWSSQVRGVLGLASDGPGSGCKISKPTLAQTLYDITSITECTPEAVEKWKSCPWG